MLSLKQIHLELKKHGTLKYIKLQKRYQLYYYDYKDLTFMLRLNITNNDIEYMSVTKKEIP